MSERAAVNLGNVLLMAAFNLAGALVRAGAWFSIEHPKDAGPAFPSIWKLPQVAELRTHPGVRLVSFHQCRFGLDAVKPTSILSNVEEMEYMELLCNHERRSHETLQSLRPDGRFRTSIAQEYPALLYEALATRVVATIKKAFPDGFTNIQEHLGDVKKENGVGHPGQRRPRRVRAQPLAKSWLDRSRWRLTFAGRWNKQEHINILEMRTLVAAMRHLARSQANWDRKFLIFTDSMVSLGALSKGRSSSAPLLRLCRRWSLFRIALGMRTFLRHVPTDVNMADGPSRGQFIGYHDADDRENMKKRDEMDPKPGVITYRGQG